MSTKDRTIKAKRQCRNKILKEMEAHEVGGVSLGDCLAIRELEEYPDNGTFEDL